MRMRPGKRVLIAGVVVAVLLAGVFTTIALPRAREADCLSFNDGTRAYLRRDTKVVAAPNFARSRVLHVDGQLLLITAAGPALTVQSRLMILTVAGSSTIRVTAYSRQAGEEVEVLQGKVVAAKAYRSSYNEPDRLESGEMSMVNQQIDLMEKERGNLTELAEWAQERVRAAQAGCRKVEGPPA